MDGDRMKLLSRTVKTNKTKIVFTVVAEPAQTENGSEDDDSVECRDVGTAEIDLAEVRQTGSDVIERELDVVDDDDGVIGRICVDFIAKEVFKSI